MNQKDQAFLVQRIRSQYIEKTPTELDELRALDRKVKKPALVFGWVFGILAALVMGAGMSLVMTDIGSIVGITEPMLPGIVIGVVGLGLLLLTFPISKGILNHRRKKYASRILNLSEKLIEQ